MTNLVTAIDIGSTKIASVIAIVDENGDIKVVGECSTQSTGVKKGEITGIDDVVNSIATSLSGAERMAGIRVPSAYVSVNGKNILSNNNKGVVTTSDMEITDDDVYRALEQAKTVSIPNSREILHAIPREFIVDQQNGIKVPIGMTGSRLEVDTHIISFPQTTRYNLEKCIQSNGLKLEGIVFSGWAAAQAVLTNTEKELGVLLLDFGGGTVSISLFVEDAIAYSTVLPYGGSNITKDLAAMFRLSLEDAEKIKKNANVLLKSVEGRSSQKKENNTQGSDEEVSDIIDVSRFSIEGVKTISRKLFIEVIEERVQEIFELIIDNIESAGFDYRLPAGVVVTGGSAQLPFISQITKKTFGVSARIAHPNSLKGLVDGVSGPEFAVAQGLILYGIQDEIFRGGNVGYSSHRSINKKASGFGKIGNFLKKLIP
jgi:cell division protein FtsA